MSKKPRVVRVVSDDEVRGWMLSNQWEHGSYFSIGVHIANNLLIERAEHRTLVEAVREKCNRLLQTATWTKETASRKNMRDIANYLLALLPQDSEKDGDNGE